MLCSVSTGKSASNWLDRLRSTKGFPTADNLDLDSFLTNSSLSNPSNSESTQSHNDRATTDRSRFAETSSQNGEKEWFGVVTNVLCDLFNMGDPDDKNSRFSGKKSSRKQTNPKFFDVSTPSAVNDITVESIRKEEYVQATTASFQSDNNSNIVGINADCCGDDDDEEEEEEEQEEKGKCSGGSSDKELKGYSKSEVTIIDTSVEGWKFDKLVFRRKNIWKVRDRKGKSWNFGPKKRKGNHLEMANVNVGCKKKAKLPKDSSGVDFVLPSSDNIQNEKREEICKDTVDDQFEVPRKRINFSRTPRKSKKNGLSVILIEAITTSKKCGRNLPKNRLKETQRQ